MGAYRAYNKNGMKRKYETILYYDPTKFLIVAIFLLLLAIAIFIYLGRLYNPLLLGLWPPLIILVLPFCFSGVAKRRYMAKKAVLDLDNESFSITLFSVKADTILSHDIFLWRDMEAYRFYFDTKDNTCLTLYLKDKRRRTFIFNDKKSFEEAAKGNSVFSNFYFFIRQLSQAGLKIPPRPGLLASNTGKIIISFEIGLLLFAIVLHLIYHSISKSYYLIFGIIFLIPQIVNRAQNVAAYEKLKKLDETV